MPLVHAGKLTEWGQHRLARLAAGGHTPCTRCLTLLGFVTRARHADGLCTMHHKQHLHLVHVTHHIR